MEVKLEHIIGYFPHNLEIEILNYQNDYVGIKDSIVTGYYYLGGDSLHLEYLGGSAGKSLSEVSIRLNHWNQFEQIQEITDEMSGWEIGYVKETGDFGRVSYDVIKLMYKHHIDIHGLIPNGKAIEK